MKNLLYITLLAGALLWAPASAMAGGKQLAKAGISHSGNMKFSLRNAKGVKMIKGPSADDKIITDPLPELPRQIMVKEGWGWAFTGGGNMMCENSAGSVNMLVRDGSTIYLSNPMSLIPVEGWLEGTVEGNKVSLKLPQLVQHRTVTGAGSSDREYNDYIVALDYGEDEEGGWYFPCPDQVYNFTVGADGSWIPEDDSIMLGHCVWVDPKDYGVDEEPQWDWQGAGDIYLKLNPVDAHVVTAPEDATFEAYNLIYNNTYVPIEVAFDNADVYFKGLCTFDPTLRDALIKGEVKGDKIVLPTGQFFGVSEEYLNTIYFMAGDSGILTDEDGNNFRKFEPGDDLTFDFDEANHLMMTQNDYCMTVTMAEPYYYDFVLNPVVRKDDPDLEVKELLPPIYWDFYPQNDQYMLPNQVVFIIPEVSAEYIPLDTDRIFYQVFVDDALFEFQPDEYDYLTETMTDVPFGYNDDWDFYGEGQLQYVFVAPFDVESLAVRYLYRNPDDSTIYSPKLYFIGDPSSVSSAVDESEVQSVEWYDLTGLRLSSPAKGLNLKVIIRSDGSRISSLYLLH